MLQTLTLLDEVPFKDVVIYPTILAKDGSRMSKSKGNGVDPMELIKMYGADAMRYNLLTLITNNQDVKFDADIDKQTKALIGSPRTEQARGFVTKIWNASRFVQMNLDGYVPGAPRVETPEDAWMLSRLARAVSEATEQLESYNLGDYARNIQSFFRGEVCDWYIELCKGRLLDGTPEEKLQVQRNLVYVLDVSMRLLHPVMPFVTESVWDALPASGLDAHDAEFLMVAKWPEPSELAAFVDEKAEGDFELAKRVISCVRSTRARYRLSPKAELAVAVRCGEAEAEVLAGQEGFIKSVGRVSELACGDVQKAEGAVSVADGTLEIFVGLGGLVDLAAEGARLKKELAKAEKDLASVERTLGNQGFVAKAAPEVIEKKRAQAAELTATIDQLKSQIADFE